MTRERGKKREQGYKGEREEEGRGNKVTREREEEGTR